MVINKNNVDQFKVTHVFNDVIELLSIGNDMLLI